MSKRSNLDHVIELLRKEKAYARERCLVAESNGEFYLYDSIAEHLGEVIHEVARIKDLLKL